MYSVLFSSHAAKFLEGLPAEDRERIVHAIERARIRPEHFFIRLVGIDSYKLRVGDYRVIADIQHELLVILIVKVGHRKNVYDR